MLMSMSSQAPAGDLNRTLFKLGSSVVTPVSILVFVATIAVALIVSAVARAAIMRFIRSRQGSEGPAYALARMTQIVILVTGVLVAFHTAGVDMTTLAAIGAALSVGIGLALQGAAHNVFSGLVLLAERPVQKGDFIVVGTTVGEVLDISLRATRLLSRDGVLLIVPNGQLVGSLVVNRSQPHRHYRARITVGVAYGSDPDLVAQTLADVADAHEGVLKEPVPEIFFRDFGDSALQFDLCVWLPDPRDEMMITSELRFALTRAFRERDITIPFPQRDLHVRSVDGAVIDRVGGRAA